MSPRRIPLRASLLLGLLLSAVACGGAQHGRTPTIDELRRRADERPDDPDAQRAVAEGELLLRGGDATQARARIDRARELAPNDLTLLYLSANEHELHGDPAAALEEYLALVVGAARSRSPLAAALAEVAAAEIEGLDDAVEGYPRLVAEALDPLVEEPGAIGDGARSTVIDLLIDLAYRRGDTERVRALTAAAGCADEWRVAGPFGPRHLLGFDDALAPESDATLAERYDYGHGRGQRPTRDVRARGCTAHLGLGPIVGAGTTYAEAEVEVASAGRWVLRVETPNAVEVFVDGASIARLDRRVTSMARVTYHPVELSAGAHLVRLKITTRHPNPVASIALSQTAGAPGGAAVEARTLTEAFLRAQRALSRGDVVDAREQLRAHLTEDGSPVMLIAGAAAALNDPLRGSTVRHDQTRRLLTWASARDERAWFPRLTLAQLEANEGRDQAAIAILRDATERWPSMVIFPLQLTDLLEQRGWLAAAEGAVEAAREAVPSACRPLRAALGHAERRSRASEAMAHARALVQCDARSDALLRLHVRRREWDLASAELQRLATLEPEASTIGELQARLDMANARGDDDAVAEVLEALGERMPRSDLLVLAEADRALAAQGAQAARQQLTAALAREPEAMGGLRRALRAIGGDSPLEAYRRDGREVIDAFEASGRVYEEPMVLVFDYTVYRVFDDGSMLELTHNIFRLDSQEAVDRMGEFQVPDGAHMLTLHTVKADGTRLEPDEIAGKETLSFPNLSPGDYIEFEYMRGRPAPAGYPGGFLGERFYFRNYETPFDLSQLTVVTPQPLELDPRGEAPETERREADGLAVYRWTARESRPFTQEPAAVAPREFFPSIYWGRGATWPQYVESLRDVLADRDVHDPAAARLVAEVVGEATAPDQVAARLHRWVLENIEDSEDVFGLSPAMLAARTGNRTRVLRYLLSMAGLDADLALARSFTADAHTSELADDDTYQHLVIRLRTPEGPRWLHAGARGAPYDFLPPHLRGMDALVLNAEAERVTVGERDLNADLRTVEVDVRLRRDGGAEVRVVETFRGAGAVLWRNQLEEIPDADLEPQFESAYVANLLPGGQLTRLVVGGREDPEQPITLRYDVDVPSLARATGGSLVLPAVYRARLGPQYARVASRTTTQLVGEGLALDVEVHVRPPEGASVGSLPPEAELSGVHGSEARMTAAREGAVIVLRRSYRMPRMRVEPAEYTRLASFCRQADEAESGELVLGL